MADGDLRSRLAEAEKAFRIANEKWIADPLNIALKEVKLSAEVAVKEIKYEMCAGEVKELLVQSNGEENALVKEAKEARVNAEKALAFARNELNKATSAGSSSLQNSS